MNASLIIHFMKLHTVHALLCAGTLLVCACEQEAPKSDPKPPPPTPTSDEKKADEKLPVVEAKAEVKEAPAAAAPLSVPLTAAQGEAAMGNKPSGTLTLTPTQNGVRIEGKIEGLVAGKHGFHVHETGDCSAADFKSAGPHFNPEGVDHGGPGTATHHAGDFGNIEAGADGVAKIDATIPFVTLEEGAKASILGRAVVLHEKADDLSSQPAGDAGARIACGVIAKPS